MKDKIQISDFSAYLFWDVDKTKLDIYENKDFIVKRVLELGQMQDWEIIKAVFGIAEIGIMAMQFRSLNPKALSFISLISNIPINQFKCYTTKQLNQRHWIY